MGYIEVIVDPTLLAFELQVLPWVLGGMALFVMAITVAMLAAWGCLYITSNIRSLYVQNTKAKTPSRRVKVVAKPKTKTA